MATCYKYLDTRNKNAKKFPLKITLSHKSKRAYISTGYYLNENEWDLKKEKIKSPFSNSGRANSKVNRKYLIVQEVIESLSPYLKTLNVYQLKDAIEKKINEELQEETAIKHPQSLSIALNSEKAGFTCFYEFSNEIVKEFYRKDKGGSAKTIENTVSSLKSFTKKDKLLFKKIDEDFLNEYESWYLKQFNYRKRKNTVNGLGFRTKEIRRIYNLAIKDKLIEDVTQEMYPFGKQGYSIKKEKIDNKNVDPSEIHKVFALELTPETKLWHHLNYFKYYFECWGMNFVDIAYLRVYQIEKGHLKYRRRKTRWSNNAKKFDIEHSPTAQAIIDYYIKDKSPNDFVFPILEDIYHLNKEIDDKEKEYENKKLFEYKLSNKRSNHIRRLKAISKRAGLEENVSIYVGRHSFFSIALRSGVSKSEISEMAGHSNFQVTEGYLAGFNGEQLEVSANMVRKAITQSANTNTLLEDKIKLKNNRKTTIHQFLSKVWLNSSETTKTPTNLLIEVLKKTDCRDGAKAQEYVNAFVKSIKEKDLS